MTQDLVTDVFATGPDRGCFVFLTSGALFATPIPGLGGMFSSPCGFSTGGGSPVQGGLTFTLGGAPPNVPGIYPAASFGVDLEDASGFESIFPDTGTYNQVPNVILSTGKMTLTVTDLVTQQFNASLSGLDETPSILTSATGTFTASLSSDAASLSFTLAYANLSSAPTEAHIHFAQPGVAGNVVVLLCGGSKGSCPAGSGTVTGTLAGADVLEISSQGVNAGSFADLLNILRSGNAYVNVYTANYAGGELRGQLKLAN